MTRQTIHLDSNQVPATLRGAYRGQKFQAIVTDSVTIGADAGLWDGGSRSTFRAVRIADGAEVPLSDNMSAPWDARRQDRTVTLQPGIAVIEHCIFCGKDAGLRIYVCPADAAPMLPATVELSALETAVLEYTYGRKSSYMGKDRCDMFRADVASQLRYGYGYNGKSTFSTVPSRAQWDEAKAALIGRGYLNKAGAITTAGKNAIGNRFI